LEAEVPKAKDLNPEVVASAETEVEEAAEVASTEAAEVALEAEEASEEVEVELDPDPHESWWNPISDSRESTF
jgi:hypothetical protein